MEIKYRRAQLEDAEQLVKIYDASFYKDYVRFGTCPGYGKPVEQMRASILECQKYVIMANEIPVGAISISDQENGNYHIGCLCIIPEYQGKGIGTKAVQFVKEELNNWKAITLDTPAEKEENVKFYTKRCGFKIARESYDGPVKLYDFILENN